MRDARSAIRRSFGSDREGVLLIFAGNAKDDDQEKNMLIKYSMSAGVLLVIILAMANTAFACACCVNRGHYERGRLRANQFYVSLLGDIKLGAAELYMTEAGFDGIKGLSELAKDEAEGRETKLEVTSSFKARKWQISVNAGMGRRGTIVLPMPASFIKHAVDIDGVDNGLGVGLYKEFTIAERVKTATGIFRSASSAKYELIFQGRGNGCDDKSDFNRWFLTVDGPRASYVIFGKVV